MGVIKEVSKLYGEKEVVEFFPYTILSISELPEGKIKWEFKDLKLYGVSKKEELSKVWIKALKRLKRINKDLPIRITIHKRKYSPLERIKRKGVEEA